MRTFAFQTERADWFFVISATSFFVLIPLILYRIRIEEKILIERVGDEYRKYMKKTKRLVPLVYYKENYSLSSVL